jgi:hypothetical protein
MAVFSSLAVQNPIGFLDKASFWSKIAPRVAAVNAQRQADGPVDKPGGDPYPEMVLLPPGPVV